MGSMLSCFIDSMVSIGDMNKIPLSPQMSPLRFRSYTAPPLAPSMKRFESTRRRISKERMYLSKTTGAHTW